MAGNLLLKGAAMLQFALTVSLINTIEAICAEKGRGTAAVYLHRNGFKECRPGINTLLAIVDAVDAGEYQMNQAGEPIGYVVL
jgi:hypothetical protein